MRFIIYFYDVLINTKILCYQEITVPSSQGSTQMRLGALLVATSKMISDYEAGTREPDINTLIKMVHILEVTNDYLAGFQ